MNESSSISQWLKIMKKAFIEMRLENWLETSCGISNFPHFFTLGDLYDHRFFTETYVPKSVLFCRVIQKTFKLSQKQKPYIREIFQNVQSSKTVHNAGIYGYFKVVIGTWCATHKCSGNLQPLTFQKLFHFFPLGVPEGTIFAIIYCAFVSIIRAVLTFSICHFVQASKGFFFGELQQ